MMCYCNDMTNTRTAATIAGISWIEDGKRAHFQSVRGYGVRQGDTFLSFNGVRPAVWGRKSTADEIASTIIDDGTLQWIEVQLP
jgi:hypothetical protein